MLELWDDLKAKPWMLSGIGVVIILVIGYLIFFKSATSTETTFPALPEVQEIQVEKEKQVDEESDGTDRLPTTILVDVKGAVSKEGLYRLSSDSRVNDAIEKAGGFTAEANRKSVNLAQKLTDEAVVYVATQDEAIDVTGVLSNGVEPGTTSGKVSLNRASIAELTTVPGIGEKRARDIVSYREEHGKFKSFEDLSNISGIGAKTLERLKSEVVLD